MKTLTLTKGNTTYKAEKGQENWIIFSRTVHNPNPKDGEANYSLKENFSINVKTYEVYCNRSGNQTNGFNRYLKLVLRIENIFRIENIETELKEDKTKHIVCFSNGIQSASVAIAVVEKYGKENCILLNHAINPYIEPESITRFGYEIANYLGMQITYANYGDYNESQIESLPNQFDVCEAARTFLNPANRQILCTNRLKTAPFMKWLKDHGYNRENCFIYYGFTKDESKREERRHSIMCSLGFETFYPLRQMDIPSDYYKKTGIKEPEHYEIFNHGNCKGCLKAGKQHWYVIYCLFPEIYVRAKLSEKRIGYSIIKSGFMEDFEPMFKQMKELGIEPTEKIKSQTFWANAKKKIKENNLAVSR